MENLLTETLYATVDLLERYQYRYALAGGLAVSMLAAPRATVDIDLCVMLTTEEFPLLFDRLRTMLPGLFIHPQPMHFAQVDIHRVVHLATPRELIIDFIVPHDRAFTESAMQRRLMVTFAGRTLPVLTPEDLVVLKTWAGRTQDLLDIAALRHSSGDGFDGGYLRRWGING